MFLFPFSSKVNKLSFIEVGVAAILIEVVIAQPTLFHLKLCLFCRTRKTLLNMELWQTIVLENKYYSIDVRVIYLWILFHFKTNLLVKNISQQIYDTD